MHIVLYSCNELCRCHVVHVTMETLNDVYGEYNEERFAVETCRILTRHMAIVTRRLPCGIKKVVYWKAPLKINPVVGHLIQKNPTDKKIDVEVRVIPPKFCPVSGVILPKLVVRNKGTCKLADVNALAWDIITFHVPHHDSYTAKQYFNTVEEALQTLDRVASMLSKLRTRPCSCCGEFMSWRLFPNMCDKCIQRHRSACIIQRVWRRVVVVK